MPITICNGVDPKDGRISPLGGTREVSKRVFGFAGRPVQAPSNHETAVGRSSSLQLANNPDRTATGAGNPLHGMQNTATQLSIAPRTMGSVTGGDPSLKIVSPLEDNVVIQPGEKTVIKPSERLQTFVRSSGPDSNTNTPFHPRAENRIPQKFPKPESKTARKMFLPSWRTDARLHSNGANDPSGSRWNHTKRGAAG